MSERRPRGAAGTPALLARLEAKLQALDARIAVVERRVAGAPPAEVAPSRPGAGAGAKAVPGRATAGRLAKRSGRGGKIPAARQREKGPAGAVRCPGCHLRVAEPLARCPFCGFLFLVLPAWRRPGGGRRS